MRGAENIDDSSLTPMYFLSDDLLSPIKNHETSVSPLKHRDRRSGGSILKSFKTFKEKTTPSKLEFKFYECENYLHN